MVLGTAPLLGRRFCAGGGGTGHDLRCIPLRRFFDGQCQGKHRRLRAQNLFDACTHGRPVFLGEWEVAAEVEQGALPHLSADAFGAHQAVSEVRLPGGFVTRGRTSDEHARSLPEAAQKSIPSYNSMALQTEFQIPALIPLKFIRGKARIRGVGC